MPTIWRQIKMLTYRPLKSLLTEHVISLVVIATLLLAVPGLTILTGMAPTPVWYLMVVITLLMLMIAANFTGLEKPIRMSKHSSNGGNQIFTDH
jgi:hypothetical protein